MPIGIFLAWCCQSPCPCGEHLPTHASTGDPPLLAGSLGSVSCGVTAPFLWVSVHSRFCLCPPRLESLFPSVLWKSYNQIPLAFKARFSGDSQPLCQIPGLERLTWGSEPSQQWENFFVIIVFQFVGHPPGSYGIWFYYDCAPLTFLLWLLCLWTWDIFFFWWVPASSCQWLFNSWLQFWCSCRRRWAHMFLLCHLLTNLKYKLKIHFWDLIRCLLNHTPIILMWLFLSATDNSMFFFFLVLQ